MREGILSSASMLAFIAPAATFGQTTEPTASEEQVVEQSGGEAEPAGGLSVIVVTAQKRSENLQDVPVSVPAVSGETIADGGVLRMEQLSSSIPNFSIQQDPVGDKINIRGIQSGNNAGLEQSVATFVDGVYRGRRIQSRFAFFDVERVEILRGAQGALFGKNTIGGGLNIATAKPTSKFSGVVAGAYTFENVTEYDLSGYVSGPVTDRVRLRLAGKYNNLDEGYIRNAFYGTRDPRIEEYAGRLSFEADVTDTTLLSARVEYGEFDVAAQPFSLLTPGPFALFGVPGLPESYDETSIGSINPVLDIGSNGTLRVDTFELAVTLAQELGDHDLTVIGAFSRYDFLRECDCDFSPLDLLRFDDSEDFEQVSIEARLASPKDERFEYILGGYYQDSSLFADGLTQFNVRSAGSEIGIDTVLGLGCDLEVSSGADPAATRECILGGLITGFDGTPLAYTDFGRLHFLDQTSEQLAVFGQGTWNATDELSLTVGLRYARERKEAVQAAYPVNYGTLDRNDAIADSAAYAAFGAPNPFTAIGEATPHSFDLGRTENSLTWQAIASYEPSPDILLYAKAGTGFKAGGFNSFALTSDPAEAEYEEEQVIGGEIGGKFAVFNGNGEVNIAAFYSEFDDIQTALFTGSTSLIVQNAAEPTSKGLELKSRFAIGNNLQVRGALVYVDFTSDQFPNAGCTVQQLLQFRLDTANPLATVQTCSAAEINDLSGRTSENTPKWTGSVGLTHELPIGEFLLTNMINLNYASSQSRQADLDPTTLQESYAKVDWIASFGPDLGAWDVALIVNNLFNVRTFSYANDTPTTDWPDSSFRIARGRLG